MWGCDGILDSQSSDLRLISSEPCLIFEVLSRKSWHVSHQSEHESEPVSLVCVYVYLLFASIKVSLGLWVHTYFLWIPLLTGIMIRIMIPVFIEQEIYWNRFNQEKLLDLIVFIVCIWYWKIVHLVWLIHWVRLGKLNQVSFNSGMIPREWKLANIVPVHKRGSKMKSPLTIVRD